MPEKPLKPVGKLTPVTETPFVGDNNANSQSGGPKPVGKLTPVGQVTVRPFTDEPTPNLQPINTRSETEDFMNRFMLKKDEIDMNMWQGFKAKFGEEGSDNVWNNFLDNRIKANAQDVIDGHNSIKWTNQDNVPFKGLSDILDRPAHFFSNQLPELLGSSLGTMLEPMMISGATYAAVGTMAGPKGTIAGLGAGFISGAAAGMVGLLSGRFMESMAEGGAAYQEALQILKKDHPNITDQEAHQHAVKVMNQVFNKNMTLAMVDIPEIVLAFAPMGKVLDKFGKLGRAVNKINVSRPYAPNFLARNAGAFANIAKIGAVSVMEGAEEGIQHYITESALNQVRNQSEMKDTSLHGMWSDPEFQSSVQSGFLLGGLLGGAGTISNHVFKSKELLMNLNQEDQIAEQKKLKDEVIYKAAKDGQHENLINSIMQQAEFLYGDHNNKDADSRKKDALNIAKMAAEDVESKFEIYDSVAANKKIKDEPSLKAAFLNSVRINEAREKIKSLEVSKTLNKDEIERLHFDIARMEKENELIGKGKSILDDVKEFEKFTIEVPKEVIANDKKKYAPKPDKDGKVSKEAPTATITQKLKFKAKNSSESAEEQSTSKDTPLPNEAPVEEEVKEKPKSKKKFKSSKEPVAPAESPFKEGDVVEVTNPQINSLYSDIRFERQAGENIVVSGVRPGETGRVTLKLSSTQYKNPAVKVKSNEEILNERYGHAEKAKIVPMVQELAKNGLRSGEITSQVKKNFPDMPYEEVRNIVKAVREKHGIPSQKDEQAYREWQDKVNPQPVPSTNEMIDQQIDQDFENFKEQAPEEKPKKKKFVSKDSPLTKEEQDVLDKLDALKIKINPGEANDVTRVITAAIWNPAVDVMKQAYLAHRNLKRAYREAIEHVKGTQWYKDLTKKDKKKADLEMQEMAEQAMGKAATSINTFNPSDEEFGITDQDEMDNILNEFFEEQKEGGVFYDDNDSRASRVAKSRLHLFTNVPGFKNREVFDALYYLVKKEDFNEGDLRWEIDKIRESIPGLAEHFDNHTDNDLVQVFMFFKNIERVPFFYHINNDKGKYTTSLSNISQETIANVTESINAKLEDKKAVAEKFANYIKRRAQINAKAGKHIQENKEAKAALYENELRLLKDVTGEDWTNWIDLNWKKWIPKDQLNEFKNYKDYYTNTPVFMYNGKPIPLIQSSISKFVIGNTAEDLIQNLTKKVSNGKKHKSNIEQLADGIAKLDPTKLGNYFDNVKNNRKSGYVLKSHLIDFALNAHTAVAPYLADNEWVNYWKEKGEAPGVLLYDGINNKQTNKKEEVGSLSESDLLTAIVKSFIDPGVLAGHSEYLHPVEQLSDKKQTVYTRAKKYSVAEAKEMLSRIRNKEYAYHTEVPTDKEINDEIKSITKFVDDNSRLLGVDNYVQTAEEFVYNYVINKHFSDLYFQGTPDNYYKKGSFDYVNQVKRAGSMHSSGEVPNTEIEGGIGRTSKHVVLSNSEKLLEIKDADGKVLYSFNDADTADGQTFHSEAWDEKVRKSTGGLYGGILKPIYSDVEPSGKRVLIKSNSILLTKEFAKGSKALQAIYNLMNEPNGADFVTVKSGVKHDVDNSVTKFDWKTGKVEGDAIVLTRQNKNWRIQQDFTQNESLASKRLTKQMLRHFMDFKSSPMMQQAFNEVINKESEKLLKELNNFSLGEVKDFLLKNIEDTDSNHHVRELLKNGGSIDHPHLRSILPAMFASNITKKMLDLKGNGALYVECTSAGKNLLPPRLEKEKGKTVFKPGQVLVPEKSGLKVGDRIFVTRVPSSNHHSTAYAEVVGFLPHSMGNVIITDEITQKIAGSDFDGDARHIWAPFKDQKGNVLKYDPNGKNSTKSLVNEAFRLAEEEYNNPDNFQMIMSPIDLDGTKDTLKKSDYSKLAESKIGNKHLPSSMIQMYRNNKDGKVVVGIVATSGKIFSFLRAHTALLAKPIELPMIEDGMVKKVLDLHEIKTDNKSKETVANNINQAVDAAKEQNLEPMGMNEFGASLYNMLEQLGVPEKYTINFFAHPLVRSYMANMREAKSVSSTINPFDVIDQMAEEIFPGSTRSKDGEKPLFPSGPIDVKLTEEDILGKGDGELRFLQKLKYLLAVSQDYFTFKSIIDLSESNPKTFGEYYSKRKDFIEVVNDNTKFTLQGLTDSPFIETARKSLDWSEQFFKTSTIFGTTKASHIISRFERLFSRGKDQKPLSKDKIEKVTEAIQGVALGEIFGGENKVDISKRLKEQIANHKEENKFLSILEFDKTDKLGLKKELRRSDMDVAETEAIKADFEKLPEELQKDLILNTYYQHAFSNSKKFGGYSMFFSNKVHQNLSEALEALKYSWNVNMGVNDELVTNAVLTIIKNNPDLIPDANFNESDSDRLTLKKTSPLYYPHFVKKMIFPSQGAPYYKVYRLIKSGDYFYYKHDWKSNFEIKNVPEVKIYEPQIKMQLENGEALASSNPELDQYIKDRLKKLYPEVNIKYISNHKYLGMDVLGQASGNTVYIDPSKAVQSTFFHEHAHLYWDALPQNDSAKKGLLDMFGSEEAAIQAIGEAGVDIASLELGSKLARFKGLLTSFWRKVKALFGISSPADAARKMADRIWNREDSVSFEDLSNDIVKFQLSSGVMDEQDRKIKELTGIYGGDLSAITPKDVNRLVNKFDVNNISEEALKEAEIELPEGSKIEDFQNNPELFYSILSGKKAVDQELTKSEFSQLLLERSYLGLEAEQKKYFEQKYLQYKADFAKMKEMWKQFPSLKSFEDKDPTELRELFNDLEGMDERARGVLYNVILDKIFSHRMARWIREESTGSMGDYRLATLAFYDMIHNQKEDFKSPLSKFLTSAKDVGEKQKMLQLHYQKIARQQAEAQLEYTGVETDLEQLAKAIKEEGGSINNTVIVDIDDDGLKTMKFKKKGTKAYAALKDSERKYIDAVVKTRQRYKEGQAKSHLIPGVNQDFVTILKKYGLYKAIQVSMFGPNANDPIEIDTKFGQMTLAKAKKSLELDKKNGLIKNIEAAIQIKKYEDQAKELRKRGYDVKGNAIFELEKGEIPMGFTFNHTEYSSDNVEAIMKEYMHKLVFKNKMEKYIPMAAYFKKYYNDGRTAFVRDWITSFNDNILFGKNPESKLGGFEKYAKYLLQWTAWRYLALNPIGMIFNLSSGFTGSARELGWSVMKTALGRMKQFKKAYGIMKHHKVVNTTIDSDLSESSKNWKRFQRAVFSTIEVAETINQAYTYIGLMNEEEWNSYDENGVLIDGKDGIVPGRHVYLMEQSAKINGSYSTVLRRPISYTTEGRTVMQFKGWLPDIFLAHWQKYNIDSYGNERKGIVNTLFDQDVWNKLTNVLQSKEKWNSLSEVDRRNLAKATTEAIFVSMGYIMIASMDDDDENKELVAGLRRAVGDVTFVFDLDNWSYTFDSPMPVLSTLKDLNTAVSDLVTFNVYKRKSHGHEAGDLTAPAKFFNLVPANRMADIITE